MGFSGLPIFNVENACASASTAFNLACTQPRAGECDVALAIGAEKMYSRDKAKTFEVFNGAWDVHEVDSLTQNLLRLAEGLETPAGAESGGARSIFMDVYAALATQHMAQFATTERQLAAVAAKNHRHSTLNPLSQYRTDMTVEQVLAARTISWPLTLPMCAPISDGAAAAILCRVDMVDRFDRARAAKVEATVLASGSDRRSDEMEKHICRRAATLAYERAGVGPSDSWSSSTICSATRRGSCHGRTTTIEPSRTCRVRSAQYVRNCSTSGVIS
jgi:acetyl-CoA acetyltransferase